MEFYYFLIQRVINPQIIKQITPNDIFYYQLFACYYLFNIYQFIITLPALTQFEWNAEIAALMALIGHLFERLILKTPSTPFLLKITYKK